MSKTEVYSWRIDSRLKRDLEALARAEKCSVGEIITRAAMAWLNERAATSTEKADQVRRRAALDSIMRDVERADPGGPPVESATNAVIRRRFVEDYERKQRTPAKSSKLRGRRKLSDYVG